MNNVILLLTVFVVLVAAGAGVWLLAVQDERDRELSARIDAQAPPRESPGTPRGEDGRPTLHVRLERVHADDPTRAHTVIELDGGLRVPLLVAWRGRDVEGRERLAAHEGALARVQEALRRRLGQLGGEPGLVRARIGADKATVPPGDAVEVLNLLVRLGVSDVALDDD